ncbi:MauE/DoxX family redox-associated membrane protein [Micromonospora sp. NPDC050187]|uniref:MauE/DoxX family redox-associated membrane protein n=1 Tax=Micromonospora sp. NPDC050187 TaxID=3364277 RepID=UPI00379837DE
MSALLAGVAAYTVVFTMLAATAEHLSRPAALGRALAAHRVFPTPAPVAVLVIVSEGLLAGTGIVALRDDSGRGLLVAFLLGSATLLGLYAGYGRHVMATGRGGPCGCSRLELPMTGWVVARAAILAGLALVGLALSGSVTPWGRADATLAVVLLAAATFAALLWHLPAAMTHPAEAAARPGGRPRVTTEGDLTA